MEMEMERRDMDLDSSENHQAGSVLTADTRGKHRILGELKRLEQKTRSLEAIDTIKQASSSIPKDDLKRLEKEIDEMNKKYSKSTEDMCKAKEKEINSPS